ncbi:hypothetical protein TWF694_007335 [Orbilia ellipsospora]|uniref:Uncharacterized protein n=1 Tax=Orbilia ellipsospora TaxID=2528407 RepID=A0AAV9XHW2_9PEZI
MVRIHALEDGRGAHILFSTFYKESWHNASETARISFTNGTNDTNNIPLSILFGSLDSGIKIQSRVSGEWLNLSDTLYNPSFPPNVSTDNGTEDDGDSDGGDDGGKDKSEHGVGGFTIRDASYPPYAGYRKIRIRLEFFKVDKKLNRKQAYYWIRFYIGESESNKGGYAADDSAWDYAYYVPKEVSESGIRSHTMFYDSTVLGPLSEIQAVYLDV